MKKDLFSLSQQVDFSAGKYNITVFFFFFMITCLIDKSPSNLTAVEFKFFSSLANASLFTSFMPGWRNVCSIVRNMKTVAGAWRPHFLIQISLFSLYSLLAFMGVIIPLPFRLYFNCSLTTPRDSVQEVLDPVKLLQHKTACHWILWDEK